jgi:hypothetical protein
VVTAAAPAPVVPRIARGGTVLCLGSGPSLKLEDVEHARSRVDATIAVNDAWTLAPWATAIMASDAGWWIHNACMKQFPGLKFCLEKSAALHCKNVVVLKRTGDEGLELDPTGLRTCRNSGGAAINLAVHFGAKRIVLLGYDMSTPHGLKREHFFGQHKFPLRGGSPYPMFRETFRKMTQPLIDAGVQVVNCSRYTELDAFPTRALEEELP